MPADALACSEVGPLASRREQPSRLSLRECCFYLVLTLNPYRAPGEDRGTATALSNRFRPPVIAGAERLKFMIIKGLGARLTD